MADTPGEYAAGDPYHRLEARMTRQEESVGEVKGVLGQLVPLVTRIDAILTSTLPHLATRAELATLDAKWETRFGELRAELAEKPSKAYLWGVLAALIAAYAAGLGALALLK